MNIIFMGTPEFAIPSLKRLTKSHHKILAVYTKEPKKSGRGHKIHQTPIHKLAIESDLKVITPKSLRKSEVQEELKLLNPDIIVVVAYGLILPKEVLEIPKYGCINIHPSLLPRWRGASPIQRAILAGDEETGVCIMKLEEGLDDGDVIKCEKIEITDTTDIQYLHDNLSEIGSRLLVDVLNNIEKSKKVEGIKQDESMVTYAKKIEKTEGKIDWTKSVNEIDRQIRALRVFPGVYFEHNGKRIKILKANKIYGHFGESGRIINNNLMISCSGGAIQPLILQMEGKKPMDIEEFLRGFRR